VGQISQPELTKLLNAFLIVEYKDDAEFTCTRFGSGRQFNHFIKVRITDFALALTDYLYLDLAVFSVCCFLCFHDSLQRGFRLP